MSTSAFERLLDGLNERAIRPGLDNIAEVMALCGNPERKFFSLHIAGTDGKGATAAICESVLRHAGYRVARYTSPHLVSVTERFWIDGKPVSEEQLDRAAERILQCRPDRLSYFERLTAVAFQLFAESGVQIAVMETGLGGRLDATNLVSPSLAVITRIGMDHTDILGDTLEKIAWEKAGIVKAGGAVVCGAMPEAAEAVIKKVADEKRAKFIRVPETISVTAQSRALSGQRLSLSTWNREIGGFDFPLAGGFQCENAATAAAALECMNDLGFEISGKAFRNGYKNVVWPGRFELISDDPPVIVDGAHNPCAAVALVDALRSCGVKRGVAMVAGFCGDKDVANFLETVAPMVSAYWAVAVSNPRTLGVEQNKVLALASGIGRVGGAQSVGDALRSARDWARERGVPVVVCGSLFLVGEVLAAER